MRPLQKMVAAYRRRRWHPWLLAHLLGILVLVSFPSGGALEDRLISARSPEDGGRPGFMTEASLLPADSIPPPEVPSLTPSRTTLLPGEEVYTGIITSSFYVAARASGLSPGLIQTLAEIFTWEIDFQRDFRQGDQFEILIFNPSASRADPTPPRVLAARIEAGRKSHWAFYYQDGDRPARYYNESGAAFGPFHLPCPVKYRRISSPYTHRRYHPILKCYRPHLEVDFAAPLGTPIRAPASGLIEFAGWKGDWGRYLSLRHNSTYITTYGHLSRYGPGIKKGLRIHRGQVIGYVGKSGLATGPHLCYRILENGKSVNPLPFQNSPPPQAADLKNFQAAKRELLAKLETLCQDSVPASLRLAEAGTAQPEAQGL